VGEERALVEEETWFALLNEILAAGSVEGYPPSGRLIKLKTKGETG
jgi:hypothetical protein